MGNEVLNPREKQILSLIVSEYITSGKPVSSRSLSRHKSIDLSPATIRNVMADLEEKGYIYQPHVSAGRIPSDAGYRFYVDNMMHLQELTLREKQRIRDQYQKEVSELDNILRDTSLLLSKISDKIGVALVPHLEKDIITCFTFIPVSSNRLLAVLVTRSGMIKEHLFRILEPLDRSLLDRVNRYVNDLVVGKAVEDALELLKTSDFMTFGTFMMGIVRDQLAKSLEEEKKVYVGGLIDFLKKSGPEGQEGFLSEEVLARVLGQSEEEKTEKSLAVRIGAENRLQALQEYTLITRNFNIPDGLKGKIAIVAEKRVNYGKIMSLLDYTGRILEEMIDDMFKED
ncbi:heat-inducible transcription repressor HrcA [Candidatus Mcinerneyibacteriota bacterium]|nr:heat-inducible transcription repressor HrcA [Candidatus Mcinerneyibacteriota bacterium]